MHRFYVSAAAQKTDYNLNLTTLYQILVGLPSFAWIFIVSSVSLFLCLYVSPLYLSIFLFLPSVSQSLPSIFQSLTSISLSLPSISVSLSLPLSLSPSLFPDKKFPALGPIPSFRSKFGNYTFIQQKIFQLKLLQC